MSKHTPAPWRIQEPFPYSYSVEPRVAWLGNSSSQEAGENLANANLIAAAPEMLEALGYIVNHCRIIGSDPSGIIDGMATESAIRALRKAKGEA